MRRTILLALLLSAVLVIAGCSSAITGNAVLEGVEATVYKSPTCNCCGAYIQGLKTTGAVVSVNEMPDLDPIKEQYGISRALSSCHTTIIDGYVIEGHVPYEAIVKLLNERPDIKGITLPGMPSGSPGMPGSKQGTWNILTLDGEVFMTI